MTPIENALLGLIRAETERVLSLSRFRGLHDDTQEWVARSTAIRDLKSGLGIRINSSWIGNSPADRQARRRGLLALEAAGLVELFATTTGHATHVRLTDADAGVTASPLPRPE